MGSVTTSSSEPSDGFDMITPLHSESSSPRSHPRTVNNIATTTPEIKATRASPPSKLIVKPATLTASKWSSPSPIVESTLPERIDKLNGLPNIAPETIEIDGVTYIQAGTNGLPRSPKTDESQNFWPENQVNDEVWTEEDDSKLIQLRLEGMTWREVLKALGPNHSSRATARARYQEMRSTPSDKKASKSRAQVDIIKKSTSPKMRVPLQWYRVVENDDEPLAHGTSHLNVDGNFEGNQDVSQTSCQESPSPAPLVVKSSRPVRINQGINEDRGDTAANHPCAVDADEKASICVCNARHDRACGACVSELEDPLDAASLAHGSRSKYAENATIPGFHPTWCNAPIKVHVGPDQLAFFVHPGAFDHSTVLYAKILQKEANGTCIMDLTDEDPELFIFMLHYFYSYNVDGYWLGSTNETLMKLYIRGVKYGVPGLSAVCINKITANMSQIQTAEFLRLVKMAYDELPDGRYLKSFLQTHLIGRLEAGARETGEDSVDLPALAEMAAGGGLFATDLTEALLRPHESKTQTKLGNDDGWEDSGPGHYCQKCGAHEDECDCSAWETGQKQRTNNTGGLGNTCGWDSSISTTCEGCDRYKFRCICATGWGDSCLHNETYGVNDPWAAAPPISSAGDRLVNVQKQVDIQTDTIGDMQGQITWLKNKIEKLLVGNKAEGNTQIPYEVSWAQPTPTAIHPTSFIHPGVGLGASMNYPQVNSGASAPPHDYAPTLRIDVDPSTNSNPRKGW